MTKMTVPEALQESFAALPEPEDYFKGVDGMLKELPRQVLCFRHQTQLSPQYQAHRRHLLMICLGKALGVFVDGKLLMLHAGEALLIRPFQAHAYLKLQEGIPTLGFISFEMDSAILEPLKMRIVPLWQEVLEQLQLIIGKGALSTHAPMQLAIVLEMLLQRGSDSGMKTLAPQVDSKTRLVTKVAQMIHDRVENALSIRELALHHHVSVSYLRDSFKRSMGQPLAKYIRQQKMIRAGEWLRNRNRNVGETARLLGFDNQESFSRAFSREMGLSPMDYRKGRHKDA